MIKRWGWAVYLTAVLGIFVFLVASAAFVGWSGSTPEYNTALKKASDFIYKTSEITILAKSLRENTISDVPVKALKKSTGNLLNRTISFTDNLNSSQIKATRERFQTKTISSSVMEVTRSLNNYKNIIEQAESFDSIFDRSRETALDAIRILLYNLVIKDIPPLQIHSKSSLLRQRALEHVNRGIMSAEKAVIEAQIYQQQKVASFHKDNRIMLLGIVLSALVFWIILSVTAIKILSKIILDTPASRRDFNVTKKQKTKQKKHDYS